MNVVITGGSGMVGSAFKNLNTPHELILVGSKDYDLTKEQEVQDLFIDTEPDAIIHLAARVGGVKGNTDFVADFYADNIRMNTNLLNASQRWGVKKVISILSTCVYPDSVVYPLTEDQIHNGAPHPSNFGYAYAKRMLDVHSRALRQQYGCNFICAVPNNLYGPRDYFDLNNSHVIPAMMRKIWEAKLTNTSVVLWGDGSPLREFTYSVDIANILLFLLENYDSPAPVTIGSTGEISIAALARKICNIMEYDYNKIEWDVSKPAGQYRKPSSNQKLLDLGWKQEDYTDFDAGLELSYAWFSEAYPNIRGY